MILRDDVAGITRDTSLYAGFGRGPLMLFHWHNRWNAGIRTATGFIVHNPQFGSDGNGAHN